VIFYGNINKHSPHAERMAAHLAMRRVAAGLIAASESASGLIHCWIRWRGWDLPQAGNALVGFSSVFDHEGDPDVPVVAVRPHHGRVFRRVRIGRRGAARGSHTLGTVSRGRSLEKRQLPRPSEPRGPAALGPTAERMAGVPLAGTVAPSLNPEWLA
jgi:hypothetical protein